ncbi:putative N-acetylated-alpha-linked acidic dipeptidase [Physella acuta]|uniref:putative N-acetylated-alpha-linked acidic dipeptidase n=1 Tax=Physella acuta TaxID=109671 RepID=UPI0027DBB0D2|nr:putative N-acetylated-alpha-linked acidic dipeptidase [Physella acuta]
MSSIVALMFGWGMPSRGYIAGKPVSRWEADSDNIDIEYKNLDKPVQQARCAQCLSGKKGLAIKALLILAVLFVGLIIGYVIRRNIHEVFVSASIKQKYLGVQQDYNPRVRDELQARVTHVSNFEDSLQLLTRDVRLSGVGGTNRILIYVRDWWRNFNFDSLAIKNYSVQLVYPDYVAQDENHVAIKTNNNTLVFETWTNNSNIHPDISPFNAYSASGNVEGDIVYCNFGRRSDYRWLQERGVNTKGVIHLIRYGKVHPSNKIKLAEENGASGVILYPDPSDYCNGMTNVSGTWWLRGDQVPSEHVRYWLTGDPSTPDYPALVGVPRTGSSTASTPGIPVYPISYNDAEMMLRHLGGTSTTGDWLGGLNVSYNTGPGFTGPWQDYKVELNISNSFSYRDIHNVIAVLRGKYEQNHYVVIGAHIDAWGYGAIDAGTSFAIIMDLARTFSTQVGKGWRPRRTIIFALWDASKYGHVGAYEWVQEYEKQLSTGGVAYINIDSAIRGNYSFYAESNPLLYDVIYKAAMSVKWPEPGQDGKSVYDVWKERASNSEFSATEPWINYLSGDQDHSPFMYRLGMSSVLTAFTYNMKAYPNLPTYPAHNTLQDTMDYVLNIDKKYLFHSALVQVLSDIVLRLADSAIIPMNVTHYSTMMNQGIAKVRHIFTSHLSSNDSDLLSDAVSEFTQATLTFDTALRNKTDLTEFDVLEINDKLIRISRAFIYEGGLLHQGRYRNVLIAPHPDNLNEEVIFPGLVVSEDSSDVDRDQLRRELVILIIAIKRAKDILVDDFGPDLVERDL